MGAFPFMIMALIYRNVPRKRANELLLLGERWSAQEALAAGIVNKVVPAEEFDAAVAEWAGKLAAKSPLIMRLGKEAMRRQLDMPLEDALDYLRAQLTLALSTEDIVEGVTAFFEKRDPVWKGTMMSDTTRPTDSSGRAGSPRRPAAPTAAANETPTSLLRPLVEDLEARRAKAMLGGGEEKIAKQHEREKLTARERIALLIDPGTFVELGIHGRPHSAQRAMDGVEAPADGVITGYGKIDGRLAAVCAYDFTVMAGSMGMTGEIKVTRLRELALTKRIPFVWLLDSAGARVQEAAGAMFAGSGHLFREEVVASGVIPQVAALMGPCAAGTAYIPGLADFVPMVQGPRFDGARRPPPGEGRGGGGRHPGGTGRLARALPQVGRGRHGSSRRRGVHRAHQGVPLLLPLATAKRRPPVRAGGANPTRSSAPRRRCWTCCRSPTASRMTCTR